MRSSAAKMHLNQPHIPTLGPRGEGWVALQTVCLTAAVAAGLAGSAWTAAVRTPAVVAAIVCCGAGLWLAASAVAKLGRAASPFPKPPAAAALTRTGVFGLVRHPIYGGLLLLSLGWSLASSPWGLAPTGLLVTVLTLKSRLEEHWLHERHPAYTAYQQRVPHRFIPYLW